jgi:hypothetical protein
MTWNPVRFVETLIHFRVAGPLGSVMARLPFISSTMASPPVAGLLTPTPQPETLLTPALAASVRDRLIPAASGLGYRVEVLSGQGELSSGQPISTETQPLVNVPLVVWPCPGDANAASGSLAALASFLQTAAPITEASLVDLCHPTPTLKDLWGALDDVVMGGVSSSQVQWRQAMVFTGTVSTANSGGFASIRTRNVEPPINLSQWQGTVLHLQGDGQRYKWILRDSSGWDSLAYSHSFDTQATTPIAIQIPFQDMVATFRARSQPDASPLQPAHICSMQLMLSKFEYDGALNPTFEAGGFQLAVSRIGVFRSAPKPLILLLGVPDSRLEAVCTQLGETHLTGIVPRPHGFEVLGAEDRLPGWMAQATINRLCQALAPFP